MNMSLVSLVTTEEEKKGDLRKNRRLLIALPFPATGGGGRKQLRNERKGRGKKHLRKKRLGRYHHTIEKKEGKGLNHFANWRGENLKGKNDSPIS